METLHFRPITQCGGILWFPWNMPQPYQIAIETFPPSSLSPEWVGTFAVIPWDIRYPSEEVKVAAKEEDNLGVSFIFPFLLSPKMLFPCGLRYVDRRCPGEGTCQLQFTRHP